ncbi:hypothetical protein ACRRTK_001892 [Alexandromys fortis]
MAHHHDYSDHFYSHMDDYGEDSSPRPEQGAAAEVGGSFCEGALSLDHSENPENNQAQGGHVSPYENLDPEDDLNNQEPMEVDPDEPALEMPEVRRRRPSRPRNQFHFTHWQVREMETVFQETQYPDVLTRAVLARNMDVPEAKVQAWFNNRRAKQRAREKKAMLRSAPRGIQDHICMMDVEEP